jgi:hypothetical protein
MTRKDTAVSLDDLNPLDLEGTPEDIALVERGLAIMARKQKIWSSVLDLWKRQAGISSNPSTTQPPEPPVAPTVGPGPETLSDLVRVYRAHKHSPYRALQYRTRVGYDSLIKRILEDHPERRLADLRAHHVQAFYDGWTPRGLPMAKSLVSMLRLLFSFGATVLEDPQCERLTVIASKLHFKKAERRSEVLTADHANLIRAKAHEMGWPSIALAQAFQFDCKLGQKDVIGEWVPESEEGDFGQSKLKWIRGLRWSDIDQNRILRHIASRGQKPIEIDLNDAPMVMEEFRKLGDLPSANSPVIVSERTGEPWHSHSFRRQWRVIADAAGVPPEVFNMDSRPRRNEDAT